MDQVHPAKAVQTRVSCMLADRVGCRRTLPLGGDSTGEVPSPCGGQFRPRSRVGRSGVLRPGPCRRR
jgi:hypothetical protein